MKKYGGVSLLGMQNLGENLLLLAEKALIVLVGAVVLAVADLVMSETRVLGVISTEVIGRHASLGIRYIHLRTRSLVRRVFAIDMAVTAESKRNALALVGTSELIDGALQRRAALFVGSVPTIRLTVALECCANAVLRAPTLELVHVGTFGIAWQG